MIEGFDIRQYIRAMIFFYIFLTIARAEFIPVMNQEQNTVEYPSAAWIESDEYNLLCGQIYQNAKQNFLKTDLNSSSSVLIENNSSNNLPPAIIVDIDETILLNIGYRKESIKHIHNFSHDLWERHIHLEIAIPISGSLNYLRFLSRQGVKTIYITNRDIKDENATFELLQQLGYPILSKEDLLLKNEKREWKDNKTARRRYVSKRYKIIQIFGDSLTDFAGTREEAIFNKEKFGRSWFLLPNPIYEKWLK